MQVLISRKNTFDKKVYEIYKKNYAGDRLFAPSYRYKEILTADYWFDMIDDDKNIVASCSIETDVKFGDYLKKICEKLYNGLYAGQNAQTYLALHDVYVEEKFRKNGYATKLLKFVLSYIYKNLSDDYTGIFLLVGNENIPALKIYIKFFGDMPLCKTKNDSIFLLEF